MSDPVSFFFNESGSLVRIQLGWLVDWLHSEFSAGFWEDLAEEGGRSAWGLY